MSKTKEKERLDVSLPVPLSAAARVRSTSTPPVVKAVHKKDRSMEASTPSPSSSASSSFFDRFKGQKTSSHSDTKKKRRELKERGRELKEREKLDKISRRMKSTEFVPESFSSDLVFPLSPKRTDAELASSADVSAPKGFLEFLPEDTKQNEFDALELSKSGPFRGKMTITNSGSLVGVNSGIVSVWDRRSSLFHDSQFQIVNKIRELWMAGAQGHANYVCLDIPRLIYNMQVYLGGTPVLTSETCHGRMRELFSVLINYVTPLTHDKAMADWDEIMTPDKEIPGALKIFVEKYGPSDSPLLGILKACTQGMLKPVFQLKSLFSVGFEDCKPAYWKINVYLNSAVEILVVEHVKRERGKNSPASDGHPGLEFDTPYQFDWRLCIGLNQNILGSQCEEEIDANLSSLSVDSVNFPEPLTNFHGFHSLMSLLEPFIPKDNSFSTMRKDMLEKLQPEMARVHWCLKKHLMDEPGAKTTKVPALLTFLAAYVKVCPNLQDIVLKGEMLNQLVIGKQILKKLQQDHVEKHELDNLHFDWESQSWGVVRAYLAHHFILDSVIIMSYADLDNDDDRQALLSEELPFCTRLVISYLFNMFDDLFSDSSAINMDLKGNMIMQVAFALARQRTDHAKIVVKMIEDLKRLHLFPELTEENTHDDMWEAIDDAVSMQIEFAYMAKKSGQTLTHNFEEYELDLNAMTLTRRSDDVTWELMRRIQSEPNVSDTGSHKKAIPVFGQLMVAYTDKMFELGIERVVEEGFSIFLNTIIGKVENDTAPYDCVVTAWPIPPFFPFFHVFGLEDWIGLEATLNEEFCGPPPQNAALVFKTSRLNTKGTPIFLAVVAFDPREGASGSYDAMKSIMLALRAYNKNNPPLEDVALPVPFHCLPTNTDYLERRATARASVDGVVCAIADFFSMRGTSLKKFGARLAPSTPSAQ